jgi:hypothetical protein
MNARPEAAELIVAEDQRGRALEFFATRLAPLAA